MTNDETIVVDDDIKSEDGDQMVTFSYRYCLITICNVAVFLGFCSSLANTQHIYMAHTLTTQNLAIGFFHSVTFLSYITFFFYWFLIFSSQEMDNASDNLSTKNHGN